VKKVTSEQFGQDVQRFLAEARNEHIVITRAGRPVAVLLGVEHKDEEDWRLEVSAEFWREIEEARRQPTVPWDAVKQELLADCDILEFMGTIGWLEDGDHYVQADILRGILRREDELVLHCRYQVWDYDVVLRRKDGPLFEGEFNGQNGKNTRPVKASGLLYANERGYVITGRWLEAGYEVKWWAELEPVESFADEKQEVGT
jgi:prevent-host-death family protein